jgi:hypothetical protein
MNSHGCSKGEVDDAGAPSIIGLTIYFIDASKAEGLGPADLATIEHTQIPPDTVRSVFGSCHRIDEPRIWKGSRLGIAQCADGTEQRLALSKYGGFFMVIGSGRWYEVNTEESRALYNQMIVMLP